MVHGQFLATRLKQVLLRALGVIHDHSDIQANHDKLRLVLRERLLIIGTWFFLWAFVIQLRLAQVFAGAGQRDEHLPIPTAGRLGMMFCIPTIVLVAYTIKQTSIVAYVSALT